jgi:hypothetical protein
LHFKKCLNNLWCTKSLSILSVLPAELSSPTLQLLSNVLPSLLVICLYVRSPWHGDDRC